MDGYCMSKRLSVHTPWLFVVLLLIVVNLPNLAFAGLTEAEPSLLTTVATPAIFFCLALYAVFPFVALYFLALWAPFALLETFYILRYGRPSDEHVFAIIRETNWAEAIAWLGPGGMMLVGVGLLLLLLGPWLVWRYVGGAPLLPKRWRILLLVSGAIALGLINLPKLVDLEDALAAGNTAHNLAPTHTQQLSTGLIGQFDDSTLDALFPWGLPWRLWRYQELQVGMENAQQTLAGFRFGAHQSSLRAKDDEIFVLVIGETGRPDRWQLNGYARATNPRLSAAEGVISLHNAVTPWAWTRMSVPLIISRKPASDTSSFFPERSIVSAFREAGFWTAWYSTQGRLGFHESAVALSANEAEDVRYINPATYRAHGTYDHELLPLLEQALARPERKKFIVLHTLGSHFNYAHRVPPGFELFQPSLRDRHGVSLYDRQQREWLNNSYDNSIAYTDFVLAEIIDRLRATGKTAVMMYVADHGENLFDGQCDKGGHGHNTEYDYRVASLWWNSAAFAQHYPDKAAMLRAHQNSPWITGNIFPTLLDAAGIEISGLPNEMSSLLQKNFIPPVRLVQTGVDFDTAVRQGVCSMLVQPSRHPDSNLMQGRIRNR